jgi:hypothetical protein
MWTLDGNSNNAVHLRNTRTVGQLIFGGNAQ